MAWPVAVFPGDDPAYSTQLNSSWRRLASDVEVNSLLHNAVQFRTLRNSC